MKHEVIVKDSQGNTLAEGDFIEITIGDQVFKKDEIIKSGIDDIVLYRPTLGVNHATTLLCNLSVKLEFICNEDLNVTVNVGDVRFELEGCGIGEMPIEAEHGYRECTIFSDMTTMYYKGRTFDFAGITKIK
jgi:hypothetical protein